MTAGIPHEDRERVLAEIRRLGDEVAGSAVTASHGRPIVLRPGVHRHEHAGRTLFVDQRLDDPTLRLVVAGLVEARIDEDDVVLVAAQPAEGRVSIEYYSPPFQAQVAADAKRADRDAEFELVTRVASVVVR